MDTSPAVYEEDKHYHPYHSSSLTPGPLKHLMEIHSLISADLCCVRKGAQLLTKPFFFAICFFSVEEEPNDTALQYFS